MVELLVVITIIALLVSIMVPAISTAKQLGYVTQSKVRIRELGDAIEAYKMDQQNNPAGLYPGQEDVGAWNTLTGSQILAAYLFNYTNANDDDIYDDIDKLRNPIFDSRYASCRDSDTYTNDDDKDLDKKGDLITFGGKWNCISDRFGSDTMPILYYPSRLSESSLAQYVEDDNAEHTNGVEWENSDNDDGATFENYIKDRRFETDAAPNSTTPYNSGKFLLIGAGKDRKYGTSDDLTNWK